MNDAGLIRVTHDGTTVTFRPDEIVTIGRHPDAALHVASRRVSRRHAVLAFEDDIWILEDKDSANGTFLNGARVTRVEIRAPMQIALGDPTGPFLTLTPALPYLSEKTTALPRASEPEATGATRSLRKSAQVITIGRAPDNDVVVEDPAVSWHHAEIRVTPNNEYELVDLSSHNGTYLNGQRVTRTPILELDRVAVGDHNFRFSEWRLEPLD
ncbi:MAG: FHA domain-containing protein [Acidimicrobiia bacterium]|nr:FHA domain-containing protein [Acidimicrobiia bacterium]